MASNIEPASRPSGCIAGGINAYANWFERAVSPFPEDSICQEVVKRTLFIATHAFILVSAIFSIKFTLIPMVVLGAAMIWSGQKTSAVVDPQRVEEEVLPPNNNNNSVNHGHTPTDEDLAEKGRSQEAQQFGEDVKALQNNYNSLFSANYPTKEAFTRAIQSLVEDAGRFLSRNEELIKQIDKNTEIPPEAQKIKNDLEALINDLFALKEAVVSSIFTEKKEKRSSSGGLQQIKRVDAHGRELSVVQVKADGNCFYYSLMLGLRALGLEEGQVLTQELLIEIAPQFRAAIAAYIHVYQDSDVFLSAYLDQAIEDYKDAKRKEVFLELLSLPSLLLQDRQNNLVHQDRQLLEELKKEVGKFSPARIDLRAIESFYKTCYDSLESGLCKSKIGAAWVPLNDALELTRASYIEKIREDGFFASFAEAYAAAKLYHLRLVIQRKVGNVVQAEDNWATFKAGEENHPRLNIIHNGDHFDYRLS